MKTTNEQMVNTQAAIAELLDRRCGSVKLAYALQYNAHKLESALVPFYSVRNEYQAEYCEKDENGELVPGDMPSTIKLAVDTAQEYQEKMMELLALEVDVEIRMMKLDWFEKLEGGVTPRELYQLDWMIEAE